MQAISCVIIDRGWGDEQGYARPVCECVNYPMSHLIDLNTAISQDERWCVCDEALLCERVALSRVCMLMSKH